MMKLLINSVTSICLTIGKSHYYACDTKYHKQCTMFIIYGILSRLIFQVTQCYGFFVFYSHYKFILG
jgi:hypothetical protein